MQGSAVYACFLVTLLLLLQLCMPLEACSAPDGLLPACSSFVNEALLLMLLLLPG
jgi:fumarate reductase subunit D